MYRRQYPSLQQWSNISRRLLLRQSPIQPTRRFASNGPPKPPPSPSSSSSSSRIDRILRRSPRFLRSRLSALYTAPITHISAFIILHEVTAVVPLFGLAGAFHYFNWLPPFFAEGTWVLAGVEKLGGYFRKKGWIDAREQEEAEEMTAEGKGKGKGRVSKWWGRGEVGTRVVIEFATAYAIVKLLIPVRLLVSAWGAPWFATWTVIPASNVLKRMLQMGRGSKASPVKAPTKAPVQSKPQTNTQDRYEKRKKRRS